jgi:hypothetical protein
VFLVQGLEYFDEMCASCDAKAASDYYIKSL